MGNTEKEELIEAVLQYGLEELEYASNELLGDREFIAELVRVYDGDYQDVLDYASEEIQADYEFISELAGMEKSAEEQSMIEDEEIDLPEELSAQEELELLKEVEHLREDTEHIMRLVSEGVLEALEYATEEVREDPEVILEAVRRDWSTIKYASEQLKSDEDFIQQLFELGKISDEQILEFASEELREDIKFFFELRDKGINLKRKKIFELRELREDSDFILGLVQEGHIEALEWASDSLREDIEFFSELAVSKIYNELSQKIILKEYVGEDLANDEEFVRRIMGMFGINQLEGASSELLGNKDFILELLDDESLMNYAEDVSYVLAVVNKELLEDKDFILSAIQLYGHKYGDEEFDAAILENVGEEVLEDQEFMLQLIDERGGHILEHAGEKLKGDREFVLAAVKDDGTALKFASDELKGDKEVVLEAVKESGDALEFASEELRGDREVVLEAVKDSGWPLEFASEELKGDREVVLKAVKESALALEFANDELKGDKEIVLEAVKKNRDALEFASDELKGDKQIVMEALSQDDSFNYGIAKIEAHISPELKKDPQIIRLVELANERATTRWDMHRKGYTYNQIAEAIAPTESMIKAVQAEMIEEMEKATEPEKDTQGQDLE